MSVLRTGVLEGAHEEIMDSGGNREFGSGLLEVPSLSIPSQVPT